jgi:serine/threonine protein kinase
VADFENQLIADRYQTLEILGQGGAGTVYKALDTLLQRLVALKVGPAVSQDTEFRREFPSRSNAVALSPRLSHPNIVQVYEVGEWNGIPFSALQLVEGRTLAQLLQEQRVLQPEYAVEIARQVTRALMYFHQHSMVHCDIKPSNILISSSGHVLLSDFGLAQTAGASSMTGTGTIIGTPSYMSPEQATGQRIDHRSDIFSLGAVLYECLTGERAFSGTTIQETLKNIVDHRLRSPLEINPSLSPEVVRVVLKALEKDPNNRFDSANLLFFALSILPRESGEVTTQVLENILDKTPGASYEDILNQTFGGRTPESTQPDARPTKLQKKLTRIQPKLRPDADARGSQLDKRIQRRRDELTGSSASSGRSLPKPEKSRIAVPVPANSVGIFGVVILLVFFLLLIVRSTGTSHVAIVGATLAIAVVGLLVYLWFIRRPVSPPVSLNDGAPLSSDAAPDVRDDPTAEILPHKTPPQYTRILQRRLQLREPSAMAWLVVMNGPLRGRQFRLANTFRIGRALGSDLTLADDSVSGMHAVILLKGEQFSIFDTVSTVGVLVNGVQVQEAPLRDQDEIQIGNTVMLFMSWSRAFGARRPALPNAVLAHENQINAVSPADLTVEEKERLHEFYSIWQDLKNAVRHD